MPSKQSAYLDDGTKAYSYKWQKARLAYLSANPDCVLCAAYGRTTQANVVDHKVDHKGNANLFWDQDNWRPLCDHCHNAKTGRTHSRGRAKAEPIGCGVDGLPTSARHHWNAVKMSS